MTKRFVEVKRGGSIGRSPNRMFHLTYGKPCSLHDLISQVPDIRHKIIGCVSSYGCPDHNEGKCADKILKLFEDCDTI